MKNIKDITISIFAVIGFVALITAFTNQPEQSNQTIVYDLCVPETGVELILSDVYGDGLEGSLYGGGTDGDFIILGDALSMIKRQIMYF